MPTVKWSHFPQSNYYARPYYPRMFLIYPLSPDEFKVTFYYTEDCIADGEHYFGTYSSLENAKRAVWRFAH